MSAYFSTQDSIEAKVSAMRIKGWGDRNGDSALDPTTLAQALVYAKAKILGMVQTRYGAQIHEWDSDTVPDILREISDTLTIWYIATGLNSVNDLIKTQYQEALASLKDIREYNMDIPEVSDSDNYMTVTDTFDSDFDDDDEDDEVTINPVFFPR